MSRTTIYDILNVLDAELSIEKPEKDGDLYRVNIIGVAVEEPTGVRTYRTYKGKSQKDAIKNLASGIVNKTICKCDGTGNKVKLKVPNTVSI